VSATVFYNGSAETATLTNTFSVNGAPTDPTAVTLVVTDPAGVATTYNYPTPATITRSGTGVYTKDISCASTVAGIWSYVWTGTGTASDVVAGTWTTFDTAGVNRRYCSVEQVKSRLRITDTLDDFELNLAIDAASRCIDDYCERVFWRGTDTRTYIPGNFYALDVDDLVSVTTLATDADGDGTYEQAWTGTDYQLLPVNPNRFTDPRPYTRIKAVGSLVFPRRWGGIGRDDMVQVAGVFGWPKVPAAVNQAALILVADLLATGQAPFGIAGFGDYAVRIRGNPRAEALLGPYRRYSLLVA
jgi:hypothetical protein